jgi:hypothetical protein
VQNLKLAGYTLRTWWLWLRRTDPDRAWAAQPFKVEQQVQDLFDASIQVRVGNGVQTFWTDGWLDGHAIGDLAPALMALVGSRTKRTRTIAQALSDNQWVRDITGGLSIMTLVQYVHLWDQLQAIQLNPEQEDVIRWMWTPDGNYNAHSTYLLMHHGNTTFPGTDLLWGSWAPLHVKLFL